MSTSGWVSHCRTTPRPIICSSSRPIRSIRTARSAPPRPGSSTRPSGRIWRGALRAIADGSEAPTAPHGWLTLEGFADEPAADVDLAFDTVGYGTVVNVEHADAGEDVHAAIRSACALLAGALELSLD